ALMRLLSRIFATAASVVPNASAKPAPSAGWSWLISSGRFGFDFTLNRGAPGRLSRRLRYRSITARCCGVGVASAPSAAPRASLPVWTSFFRLIGSVIRKFPDRAIRLGYVAERIGWMAQLSTYAHRAVLP